MQDNKRVVNATMVTIARESRGFTQKELAAITGISQPVLSKYENGIKEVEEEHLVKISGALGYERDFFYVYGRMYGFSGGHIYSRRRAVMSITELKKWEARANIFRLQLKNLWNSVDVEPAYSFPSWDIGDHVDSPEHAAQELRRLWNMPSGPVTNLCQTIEDAGGVVYMLSLSGSKLDAMSHITPLAPPIFFGNNQSPMDRFRFSMAHEIGHVVLHRIPSDDVEKEADRFGVEFLMPARDILPHFKKQLSLPYLAELKAYWKVSMAALVRRAYNLEAIPEYTYQYWWKKLAIEYRNRPGGEPIELPREEPTLLRQIMDIHRGYGYSDSELAKILFITQEEFELFFTDRKIRKIAGGKSTPTSPTPKKPQLYLTG